MCFHQFRKKFFFFFFSDSTVNSKKNSKVIYNLEMLVMFMYLSVFLGNVISNIYIWLGTEARIFIQQSHQES